MKTITHMNRFHLVNFTNKDLFLINNKTISNLNKISKKFFSKYTKHKHFYGNYESDKQESQNFKSKFNEENYYTPKQDLIFLQNKIEILTSKSPSNRVSSIYLLIFTGMACGFSYLSVSLFLKSKYLWGILSSLPALIGLTFTKNNYENQKHNITAIYLLKDGKTVEIKTMAKKFKVDISKIKRVNKEEMFLVFKNFGNILEYYFPIFINNNLYFIARDGYDKNNEIFSAISNGMYIAITDNQIKPENIINI